MASRRRALPTMSAGRLSVGASTMFPQTESFRDVSKPLDSGGVSRMLPSLRERLPHDAANNDRERRSSCRRRPRAAPRSHARSPRDVSAGGACCPIAFVTYSLAYLDRSNYSIAVAGGMKDDLHITAWRLRADRCAFFLGYFVFQIPGAHLRRAAQRQEPDLLVASSLWGVLASLQGLLTDVTALIVVRFLVGVVEAAVLPAMVIFLAHWFTKRSAAARTRSSSSATRSPSCGSPPSPAT